MQVKRTDMGVSGSMTRDQNGSGMQRGGLLVRRRAKESNPLACQVCTTRFIQTRSDLVRFVQEISITSKVKDEELQTDRVRTHHDIL